MEDFDREALAAKADKSGSNAWFWAVIGALPVAGIAAGLVLGFGWEDTPTMKGIDAPEQAVRMADAPNVEPVPAAQLRPTFSALAEVEKYQTTLGTLSQCASGHGASQDRHMARAIETYRKANETKVAKLRDMAHAEYKRSSVSRLERLPESELELWAGAMTGQLQRDVAQDMTAIAAEFDRQDRMRAGYLGTNPNNSDCIQFRNEVIMGKQNVRLG